MIIFVQKKVNFANKIYLKIKKMIVWVVNKIMKLKIGIKIIVYL